MQKSLKTALIVASLLTAPAAFAAQPAAAQGVDTASAKPQFAQGSMNVFRRFPPEIRAQMIDYYGKALGLQPLQPIQVNANLQMILFRVGGGGQIKLGDRPDGGTPIPPRRRHQ